MPVVPPATRGRQEAASLVIARDTSLDGRGPRRGGRREPSRRRRVELDDGPEPALNAPWPAVALALVLVTLYALQALVPDQQTLTARLGFAPASLADGRWTGLVTALFVHGGWLHVLLNAIGALAFGAPVARLFGLRASGVAMYFGFYLVCGILGSLGYAVLHLASRDVLIGASGAVSGLMGASSRMIERRRGLAPFTSAPVIGMAAAWVIINALTAVLGFNVGLGAGQLVAWEAHLAGYAAGLLLIWPAARLMQRV